MNDPKDHETCWLARLEAIFFTSFCKTTFADFPSTFTKTYLKEHQGKYVTQ